LAISHLQVFSSEELEVMFEALQSCFGTALTIVATVLRRTSRLPLRPSIDPCPASFWRNSSAKSPPQTFLCPQTKYQAPCSFYYSILHGPITRHSNWVKDSKIGYITPLQSWRPVHGRMYVLSAETVVPVANSFERSLTNTSR
jgi:hypothetical protein